jgi:homopolymeric O-antigen transport system permease protein
MNSLAAPFRLLFRHAQLIRNAVATDLKQKHAGTSFGLAWLVLTPLLLLAVYSVVYLFIFKLRPSGMTAVQYVLYIFCGLVPFLAMSEALTLGTSSLSAHKAILKITVFPAEIVPVRAVLTSQSSFVVGIGVLIVGALFWGRVSAWWLMLPVVFVLQVLLVTGVVWMLSIISLVVKDIQNIISIVVMLLMMLCPIAYTPEMLPPLLRPLIWINPFAYFVMTYQSIIMLGRLPDADILLLAILTSLIAFGGGFAFFSRVKGFLSDYA